MKDVHLKRCQNIQCDFKSPVACRRCVCSEGGGVLASSPRTPPSTPLCLSSTHGALVPLATPRGHVGVDVNMVQNRPHLSKTSVPEDGLPGAATVLCCGLLTSKARCQAIGAVTLLTKKNSLC